MRSTARRNQADRVDATQIAWKHNAGIVHNHRKRASPFIASLQCQIEDLRTS
jgi:hypothetical protein